MQILKTQPDVVLCNLFEVTLLQGGDWTRQLQLFSSLNYTRKLRIWMEEARQLIKGGQEDKKWHKRVRLAP